MTNFAPTRCGGRAFPNRAMPQSTALELASERREPYLIVPANHDKPGVVLVHGFLASPAELKELGQRLAELGHPVLGRQAEGPRHVAMGPARTRTGRIGWLRCARGYEIMSLSPDEVLVVRLRHRRLHVAALCRRQAATARLASSPLSPPLKFRVRNVDIRAALPWPQQGQRMGLCAGWHQAIPDARSRASRASTTATCRCADWWNCAKPPTNWSAALPRSNARR